jgi:hypothetical protein
VTTTWSWTPTPPWKRNLASLGTAAGKVVENLGKIMKKHERDGNIWKIWELKK